MDGLIRDGNLIVTPVVNDYILAKAYMNMVDEGVLDTVFFQGTPTVSAFIKEHMTEGKRVTLGCFHERSPGDIEFCGLGWAFGAESMGKFKRAEVGMTFFRRVEEKKSNLKFGQMMFESFFSRFHIDSLFGLTPEPNKLALRYAQKLGMSLHGPIPQYCCWKGDLVPGWISHISREQWVERNRSL